MIDIRPYHLDDVAAIAAIANVAMPYAWSKQVFIDCVHAGYLGWVAEASLQIRGFIIAQVLAPECQLLNICVDPAFTRQKIASQLFERLLTKVRGMDCQQMYLEVREGNHSAIAGYECLKACYEAGVNFIAT